jgi:predicted methyltransferase
MQDWLTLEGRSALVFGAGGLGGASALALAARGARVALVDVNEENLNAVARAAKDAGGDVKPLAADLRTAQACRAAGRRRPYDRRLHGGGRRLQHGGGVTARRRDIVTEERN